VVVLACLGQGLGQAVQDVLAVAGQVMPGVGAGDQDQVTGAADRLVDVRRGVVGGGADHLGGGDLDRLGVPDQAQVLVEAGDSGGRAGLAGAEAPVKTRFFQAGRRISMRRFGLQGRLAARREGEGS
jgi:hypothetical protein